MASIFTKIVQGEIPSYTIAEDDQHLAFLDMMPLVKGHCLVIPKQEVDLIFDLENEDFKNLWSFAQTIARKMEKAFPEQVKGKWNGKLHEIVRSYGQDLSANPALLDQVRTYTSSTLGLNYTPTRHAANDSTAVVPAVANAK